MPSINRTSTNHSMASNALVPLELLRSVPRSVQHIVDYKSRYGMYVSSLKLKPFGDYEVVRVLALYYRRIQMLSIDCCPTELIPNITLPHGEVRLSEHAIARMLFDSYEFCFGLPVIMGRKLEIKTFIRLEIPVRSSLEYCSLNGLRSM